MLGTSFEVSRTSISFSSATQDRQGGTGVSEPAELLRSGSFVTEVGIRQAWLFLTLCNNAVAPAQETRLFLDTNWSLGVIRFSLDTDELEAGLLTLCRLINRTLARDAWMSGADLVLDF